MHPLSKNLFAICLILLLGGCRAHDFNPAPRAATEYHVATTGSNENPGSVDAPFATISRAADVAHAGDTITVHAGIYRESINPPQGGSSDSRRITYRAAQGERVVIKGSERIRGWRHIQHDTWSVQLPNSFFGNYNPYATVIAGDWFEPLGGENRRYHTGSVYLDGHWLQEASELDAVFQPIAETPLWFGQVDTQHTTLYAQFEETDPNQAFVEINVRETVFYPRNPGINYITVRGFILEQAAPNWAPPTAEQVGLIGTHWSKGWIVEDNTIRYSICSGLTLGKYGDRFDNQGESAKDYIATIRRALREGWNRQNVGSHTIRNNHISHCEQAGIVGSMGGAFSLIEGNTIHDINLRGMLGGHEMAGIKLHGPIDTTIRNNHIFRCGGSGGLWLDWMSQGTRVTGNLMHSNRSRDLFVEVNHGPFLIDHNVFLSNEAILDWSQGGAYAHNLIAGRIHSKAERSRKTPFFNIHSTDNMQIAGFTIGDERYINNWLIGPANLDAYGDGDPIFSEGNLFQREATVRLQQMGENQYLTLPPYSTENPDIARNLVTTERLGRAQISNIPFKSAGGLYRLDADYFGNPRQNTPIPGPFSGNVLSSEQIRVWPRP